MIQNRNLNKTAKIRTVQSKIFDVSEGPQVDVVLVDNDRDNYIHDVHSVCIIDQATSASTFTLGTENTADYFGTVVSADSDNAYDTTQMTTFSKRILPKGQQLVVTSVDSASTGMAKLIIQYYGVDEPREGRGPRTPSD